jgi:hypothetical protein
MGGFAIQEDGDDTGLRQRIEPSGLWKLLQEGAVPWSDVDVTDLEIEDRSKADWLVKLLALTQILWFSTQIIGRAVQGLSITTLELFTLGIVFCAVVMYIALWEMPFDVRVPITIRTKVHVLSAPNFIDRVKFNRHIKISSKYSRWILPVAGFVCFCFGGLHIVAWNFHFPTGAERLLWRISSTGCLIVMVYISFLFIPFGEPISYAAYRAPFKVVLGTYILFRLYMFVEMFTSLRAVPASVYQTPQWSQYFPSFG